MPGRPANAAEAPHPQGRKWIVGIGLVAAIVAAGVLFRVDAPHHAPLRARSTLEFFAVFTRCLSWPFVDYGWAAAVMQAPLVWLVAARWRQKEPLAPQELAALALGLFAVLHAVAIAFGRGAGLPDHRPLSRYQDPLLLGACAQLFALLRLNAGRIPVLVWSGTAAIGLLGLTIVNLTLHLPHKRAQDRAASALIGKYQHSGDYQGIAQDPLTRLLHPTDPAAVERMLTHATLRPYWPGEIRGKDHPRLMLARAGLWLTVVTGAILGAMIALLGAKTPLSTRA